MKNLCFLKCFINIPITHHPPSLGSILAASGRIFMPLGLHLAPLGLLLGLNWRLWSSILGFLGASNTPLGASWAQLGPLGLNF